MRITHVKYYTPVYLAKQCIETAQFIIGKENITEYIEPSAGNGSFSRQIPNCIAFDIAPEASGIIEQDYLSLELDYLPGRLVIGNPPFGNQLKLAQKFFKHSITFSEYIAFILPISQLNNNVTFFEYDLIYSEDLGIQYYTDRDLHCVFNIYKRPKSGILNKRPTFRLKDISIVRQDSKKYENAPFDIRMCYWGDSSAGKILQEGETYAAEYKLKVHRPELLHKVLQALEKAVWKEELDCIAMVKITQRHLIQYLKREVPELE